MFLIPPKPKKKQGASFRSLIQLYLDKNANKKYKTQKLAKQARFEALQKIK